MSSSHAFYTREINAECSMFYFSDLEVAVESDSSESLEGAKDSSYNDSCTAPLSPKERVTDI